jgi:hypothetical protein
MEGERKKDRIKKGRKIYVRRKKIRKRRSEGMERATKYKSCFFYLIRSFVINKKC